MWRLWRVWWIWFWCRIYWILGITLSNKDIPEATLQRCCVIFKFTRGYLCQSAISSTKSHFGMGVLLGICWIFSERLYEHLWRAAFDIWKVSWENFYYFSSTVAVIHRCSLKRSILKNFAKLTGKHLGLQIVSLPSETSFVFFRYSGERQW